MADEHALFPSSERSTLEKEWSDRAAYCGLSLQDYDAWAALPFVYRTMLTAGRTLVLWHIFMGRPVVTAVYEVRDVSLTDDLGVEFTLSDRTGGVHSFGHTPRRLGKSDVFLWTPYFMDVQYTPGRNGHQVWFSVVCRQPGKPSLKLEQQAYLTDVRALKTLFPEVSATKF